jgi:chaperone modulatory protein CbpM
MSTPSASPLKSCRQVQPDVAALPAESAPFMTCKQLSGCSGMSMMELGELVGYSALMPVKSYAEQPDTKNQDHWVFSAQWLKPLRAACKLRNDFDLDLFTVAIMLGNLRRIEELEQSLRIMELKMHRLMQPGADQAAEFERDDRAQLDLFHKKKQEYHNGKDAS